MDLTLIAIFNAYGARSVLIEPRALITRRDQSVHGCSELLYVSLWNWPQEEATFRSSTVAAIVSSRQHFPTAKTHFSSPYFRSATTNLGAHALAPSLMGVTSSVTTLKAAIHYQTQSHDRKSLTSPSDSVMCLIGI